VRPHPKQPEILQLVRDGLWLNAIKRRTGATGDTIHRIAHRHGLVVAKAPEEALGRNRYYKPVGAKPAPKQTAEQAAAGQTLNARWGDSMGERWW